jgi:hypothetical protein
MIQPPLCLVLLPAPAWDATGPAGMASLAALTAQLCLIARKLPKGVALAALRAEMLAISRQIQVQAGAGKIPTERVKVPDELLSPWDALLSSLAGQRAKSARAAVNRRGVPTFLPCVFPPAPDPRYSAGGYGPIDLAAHLRELDALQPEDQGLAAAVAFRRGVFERARGRNRGIVEVME